MLHWAYRVNAYFDSRGIDVIDFLVFARLYLLCRVITYHSRLLRDSSSQSLGCLNQVPIDFFFIIKAYLEQSPVFCLILFFFSMFSICSWSLRACDYTADHRHLPIGNATWLFLTLFTTVGESFLISFLRRHVFDSFLSVRLWRLDTFNVLWPGYVSCTRATAEC